ncbi:MAG: hypothetical protein J6A63_08900 [Clostridia bacterium]|nr:hypothetical protein [Clostridia bacterium]
MKQFETKLTVRIYDTKVIEKLNYLFKKNPNQYQTKNQLLVELLEIGMQEKLKEIVPLSYDVKSETVPNINGDFVGSLKQVKQLIESMHVHNQKQIEGIVAHLKMSERLSAAIYNTLLAVATDEPVTEVQINMGIFDEVPDRFEEYLNELLSLVFKADDSGGGKKGGDLKS